MAINDRRDPYLYQHRQDAVEASWSSAQGASGPQDLSPFRWSMLFDSSRKLLAFGIVILFGLGVGLYTLLTPEEAPTSQDIPLIRPLNGPTKVLPDDPGGIQVPHQDKLIYERLNPQDISGEPEQLMPEAPEQSYPPLEAPSGPQRVANLQPADFDAWPKAMPPHLAAKRREQETAILPLQPQSQPYAQPQQDQPYPQDQQLPHNQQTDPLPPQAPHMTTPAEAPQNRLPKERPVFQPPAVTAESLSAAPPAQVEAQTQSAQEHTFTAPPAKTTPRAKGTIKQTHGNAFAPRSYQVQIGSLPSLQQATEEKKRLWKRHADVLAKHVGKIARVDLKEKGVHYRIMVGPLASEKAARDLCAKLSTRKVGCIMIKPNP